MSRGKQVYITVKYLNQYMFQHDVLFKFFIYTCVHI